MRIKSLQSKNFFACDMFRLRTKTAIHDSTRSSPFVGSVLNLPSHGGGVHGFFQMRMKRVCKGAHRVSRSLHHCRGSATRTREPSPLSAPDADSHALTASTAARFEHKIGKVRSFFVRACGGGFRRSFDSIADKDGPTPMPDLNQWQT